MREPRRAHLLQEDDDPLEHLGALLLQAKKRARRAHKHFGLPVGHVVVKAAALQEPLDGLLVRGEVVVGPRELRDHFVPAGWDVRFWNIA